LQDELGGHLDDMEVYWAAPDAPLAADPLTLPDPVNWEYGYRVSLIDASREFDDFPVVAVFEGEETPVDCEPTYAPAGNCQVFVGFWVAHADEETVTRIRSRYQEAIKRVIAAHTNLMGYNRLNRTPRVEPTPVIRATDAKDDRQQEADLYFIQGALITSDWRH
jgi:hypothetical protein